MANEVVIAVRAVDGASPVVKKVEKSTRALSGAMLQASLSSLFFGMALQRVFRTIAREGVTSFQKIMNESGFFGTAISQLAANWEYLKFTIGQAIDTALRPLLPYIISAINWIAKIAREHPKWTAAIIIGGLALGTFLLILGQVGSAITGAMALKGLIVLMGGAGAAEGVAGAAGAATVGVSGLTAILSGAAWASGIAMAAGLWYVMYKISQQVVKNQKEFGDFKDNVAVNAKIASLAVDDHRTIWEKLGDTVWFVGNLMVSAWGIVKGMAASLASGDVAGFLQGTSKLSSSWDQAKKVWKEGIEGIHKTQIETVLSNPNYNPFGGAGMSSANGVLGVSSAGTSISVGQINITSGGGAAEDLEWQNNVKDLMAQLRNLSNQIG